MQTILIIDDCTMTATPLEIALTSRGEFKSLLLSNAADALKILGNPDSQVTAIVTDLHLPQMNGFELIEKIRTESIYARIPIVVISGDSNPANRTSALEKGANAFFAKPYSPADVLQELERLLHAS